LPFEERATMQCLFPMKKWPLFACLFLKGGSGESLLASRFFPSQH
jgi:hypothetical protein